MDNLYTRRKPEKCLLDAHDKLFTNIKLQWNKLWIAAIAYSAIIAITAVVMHNVIITTSYPIWFAPFCFLGIIAALIFLRGNILHVFTGRDKRWSLTRTLKAELSTALLVSILMLVIIATIFVVAHFAKQHYSITMIVACCLNIIFVFYAFFIDFHKTKYMIDSDMKAFCIGKSWKALKGNIKYYLATTILYTFVTAIVLSIISMPLIILIATQVMAYEGACLGDPLGLPENFCALLFGVVLIVSFLQCIVLIWTDYVKYYLYGSIIKRKTLKEETTDKE